jgi:membrane-bound serine protease (ClpP class)
MATSLLLASFLTFWGASPDRPDSTRPVAPDSASARSAARSSPTADSADAASKHGGTVVIPIHGEVDEGLRYFVKRAIETALAAEPAPQRILFDVDTWGGRLDAAFEISDAVTGIKSCSTAAFVAKKAISAGALIALSTHRVYMAPGATIGDCAPIIQTNEGPQFLGEKIESPLRARFRALARRANIPTMLAEKMVTKDLGVVAAKDSVGTLVWFTAKNWDDLSDSAKSRYRSSETVVEDGQLLTLDDEEAAKWGFSAGTFADAKELERAKGWTVSEPIGQSWSESFVRWISKYVSILFVLGLAAVYMEYKTPGFGFFGIAGILLLSLALGSQFMLGMASYTALFLAAIGILLIGIEVLVAPGTVFLAAAGLICLLAALVLSLQGFSIPDPHLPWQALRMKESLMTVGLTALAAAVVSFAALRWLLPLLPLREGPYLQASLSDLPSTPDEDGDANWTGRVGTVVSPLRPVGRIAVDGQELQAVSNTGMLATGTRVKLLEKHHTEWLVEPIRGGDA